MEGEVDDAVLPLQRTVNEQGRPLAADGLVV